MKNRLRRYRILLYAVAVCGLVVSPFLDVSRAQTTQRPKKVEDFSGVEFTDVGTAPLNAVAVILVSFDGRENDITDRTKTNTQGEFTFRVKHAGKYILTLEFPAETTNGTMSAAAAKEKGPSAVNVKLARIEIDSVVGGTKTFLWDPARKRQYQPLHIIEKSADAPKIIVESNGKDQLRGKIRGWIKASFDNGPRER